MTDWGALYTAHVEALAGLVSDLGDEQLESVVPATPEWTVRDVLAHLAGTAADAVAGRMDGAPGPEWTGRHVGERAGRTAAELVAELRSSCPAVIAEAITPERPAMVWNLVVHHADLHEALAVHPMPDRLWRPVAEALPPTSETLAAIDPYELFRAQFSRRSRAQLAAWSTGLPTAELDALGLFGPRDDDQPLPAPPPS